MLSCPPSPADFDTAYQLPQNCHQDIYSTGMQISTKCSKRDET